MRTYLLIFILFACILNVSAQVTSNQSPGNKPIDKSKLIIHDNFREGMTDMHDNNRNQVRKSVSNTNGRSSSEKKSNNATKKTHRVGAEKNSGKSRNVRERRAIKR